MTSPKSRLAYQMHFDLLDRAMSDPKGIRIKQDDAGKAWRLRLEFHHARDLDRKDNAQTYEQGHQLHGNSIYDCLLVTIEMDDTEQVWLYVHKRDANAFHVEDLSSVPEAAAEENLIDENDTTPLTEMPTLASIDRR